MDIASQCSMELAIHYPCVVEHKVRVIGYVDCKWYIDSLIEDIMSHLKLWVYGKHPLFRLACGPN